jgi:hypothetical protein
MTRKKNGKEPKKEGETNRQTNIKNDDEEKKEESLMFK